MDALLERLAREFAAADAIVVGAGAGLSAAAGFDYAGERFERLFGDLIEARGFRDMYTAGFFDFPTPEERWAFWSRMIWCNRYEPAPKDTYSKLMRLLFFELGVGGNTPGIIKYPFWQMVYAYPRATYACVNQGQAVAPEEILDRSILIDGDIDEVLGRLEEAIDG